MSRVNNFIRKWGEEEGKKRYNSFLHKIGSGWYYSGWFEKYHFKSLYELSYIKHLLDNNIKFKNADNSKFVIKYIDANNKKRNYFPDFYLIESEEIIEIKSRWQLNEDATIRKLEAAKKIHGDKFKVLTEDDLFIYGIRDLIKDKKIIWSERSKEKISDK